MFALARDAGSRPCRTYPPQRYFVNRADGTRLPDNSEELLVATVSMLDDFNT